MKRKVFIYILLGGMLIAIAAATWMYFKPHRSVKAATPAFTLSASELLHAFTTDEASANALYGGKVLQVSGVVTDMVSSDTSMVLQMGNEDEMAFISCYLDDDEQADYSKLQRGKSVTIKGICNGMLLDVVLDKCVLLTHEQ